jgi:hypothetical protein
MLKVALGISAITIACMNLDNLVCVFVLSIVGGFLIANGIDEV